MTKEEAVIHELAIALARWARATYPELSEETVRSHSQAVARCFHHGLLSAGWMDMTGHLSAAQGRYLIQVS